MMSETIDFLKNKLLESGIRPSYHRIRILGYLYRKESHPTVEEIYNTLSPEIPSLSKATVYNTLHKLIGSGLARSLNIDEFELRYDITMTNHGHFQCEVCSQIYNFSIDFDDIPVDVLHQFLIKERNVYYKGFCPDCLSNSKTKQGVKDGN